VGYRNYADDVVRLFVDKAAEVGIEHVRAEVLPDEKQAVVADARIVFEENGD